MLTKMRGSEVLTPLLLLLLLVPGSSAAAAAAAAAAAVPEGHSWQLIDFTAVHPLAAGADAGGSFSAGCAGSAAASAGADTVVDESCCAL
jgi:hypothetical protein